MRQDPEAAEAEERGADAPSVDDLSREIARLRRTLLKHGHAQELFQGRVEDAMAGLAKELERPPRAQARRDDDGRPQSAEKGLSTAQLRSLVELGQAARNLLVLAAGGLSAEEGDEDSPRSVREGLDLLEIRVSNLQRSFGLEPIPARGRPFDDRFHRAHGVCQRSDLPDGQVVEVVLPGYLIHGEVERPALVIVNQLVGREKTEHEDSERETTGTTR